MLLSTAGMFRGKQAEKDLKIAFKNFELDRIYKL